MKLEVARPLGLALLAVAAFIFVIPFLNVGLQVWPWKFGVRDWRFGAWGFFLGAITLPALGLGLLAVAGMLRESSRLLRVVLVLAVVMAVLVLLGGLDFELSGMALKRRVTDPRALPLYVQEMRRTMLISLAALPSFGAIALAAYKLLGHLKSKPSATQRPDSLLHISES